MTLSIRTKIFLAILVTALISVLALQQIQRHNFEKGLRKHSRSINLERFQPLVDGLEVFYQENESWNDLKGRKELPTLQLLQMAALADGDSMQNYRLQKKLRKLRHQHKRHKHKSNNPLLKLSLFDNNKQWVAGRSSEFSESNRPIMFENKVVGYLVLNLESSATRHLDKRFSEQQTKGALMAVLLTLAGALLFALLISKSLSRPINKLLKKVQHLSDGDYQVQSLSLRNDELGKLEQEFDKLANSLQQNRQHRRQWVSDIAHELRTPVAVLKSELECIEDGHQALDMNAIKSLKSEVERLNLLIGDLHQLSQSDSGTLSYQFEALDLAQLVHDSLDIYGDKFAAQQIEVETNLDDLPLIQADALRLKQVIDNILLNTLRYTDPNGKLVIAGLANSKSIELKFEDTSPSVPTESIPKLFDRLYRVDESRSRNTGASGLGLAICASIIEAHGGEIYAEASPLGGLGINIKLPQSQV